MKKLFVAVAVWMGLGATVAFANHQNQEVQVVMQVNDFTPIAVKDLPKEVQETLKKDFPDYKVKEAAVEKAEDGTQVYKVTLQDAEGIEVDVFFDEKGVILE